MIDSRKSLGSWESTDAKGTHFRNGHRAQRPRSNPTAGRESKPIPGVLRKWTKEELVIRLATDDASLTYKHGDSCVATADPPSKGGCR